MDTFIGVEVVKAEPCSKFEYIIDQPYVAITYQPGNTDEEGFIIKSSDGRISWKPKEIFEAIYRRVDPTKSSEIKEQLLNDIPLLKI